MQRRNMWLIAGFIILACCLVGYFIAQQRQKSIIEGALEWARMEEIPDELKVVSAETRGSMFMRQFIITVVGKRSDLEQWLEASPGIRDATKTQESGVVIYRITPGGGAGFAKVRYAPTAAKVIVRAYWS